jgi:hypothetical protein
VAACLVWFTDEILEELPEMHLLTLDGRYLVAGHNRAALLDRGLQVFNLFLKNQIEIDGLSLAGVLVQLGVRQQVRQQFPHSAAPNETATA